MEIKTKINKWDLIKTKKICTTKEGKRTPLRMGENNSKQNNWQIINLQIYKQLMQLNTRKTSNPIKKWAEDLNRHFSKDIQIANNTWKNAQYHSLLEKCKSKPQWGTTSHWSECPSSKSLQTINAGEGVEKRKTSYTVGANENYIAGYCGDSFKNWE